MGITVRALVEQVIGPALSQTGLYTRSAEQLMLGTAAQESRLGSFLKQFEGPALGIWQVEPKTHHDIWNNYLKGNDELIKKICNACYIPLPNFGTIPYDEILIYNLRYACIMGRLVYFRNRTILPAFDDIQGQAVYWKTVYNSFKGKGDTAAYIQNYNQHVRPYYHPF